LRLIVISGIFLSFGVLQGATNPGVIGQYCVGCHSQRLKTGGLVLEGLDASKASDNADVWEKVVRKLRTNAMPPPGLPQPDPAARQNLIAHLTDQLDHAAEAHPNPGRPVLHRLNRAEYANAIRDLLALNVDAAALLPPDDSAYGFDNISDALGLSPALQEHYLSAALKIGALAVGDPHVTPGSETYRIKQDLSQNQHIEGMPIGTLGGTRVLYNFPLDGEYIFQAKLYRTNLNIMRGLSTEHQVEFAVDGTRVRLATLGGPADLAALFEAPTDTGDAIDARLRVRIPVKAGPHEVTAAFLQGPMVAIPDRLQPYIRSSVDNFDWAGLPHMQTFSITGPFDAKGPGDTPARRRIFICHAPDNACAKQIVSTLARRAYRQPVTDADLKILMNFYDSGRKDGGFEAGIETALQRILASPKFVFRVERDPAALPAIHRVSDVELASRLSFFLWSSIPDDDLLNAASQGTLEDPVVLEREVRRMLADPKAEALVSNFAGQWLHLRNVPNVLPNSDLFPDFDENLRQSMRRETELLFESMIHEDRGVLNLLTADYTFVNERLARHYGIPDIYGSRFRRVEITDEARKGLLGQASILAVTSHAERTSPVVRGKFILENILGMPVPPPPPDVPPLKATEAGEQPKTIREQMAEHRANPACATCHKIMDPIGFSLENFDAVGAWRAREPGGPIDASGQLADGTKVDGVAGLRDAIVRRPDMFASTLTEKLLTYGLGRGLDYYDMPAVRSIVRDAAQSNYRFSAIVIGIVRSTPFQMRAAPPRETESAVGRIP
jgi:mono/diheme cytochrome c family protein